NVDDIVHWFDEGGALKITPDERSEALLRGFTVVPGLLTLIDQVGLAVKKDPATMVSACELILEGLVAEKRIARSEELGYVPAPGAEVDELETLASEQMGIAVDVSVRWLSDPQKATRIYAEIVDEDQIRGAVLDAIRKGVRDGMVQYNNNDIAERMQMADTI